MINDQKAFNAFCVSLGCAAAALVFLLVAIFTREIAFLIIAGLCGLAGIVQQIARTPWGDQP